MGVSGLTSFIDKFPLYQYCSKIEINHEHSVLVDGFALAYYLYQQDNGAIGRRIDWMLGGEYQAFSDKLIRFVSWFKTVGTRHMCFVFDGMLDAKKRETDLARSRQKSVDVNTFLECREQRLHDTSLFMMPPCIIDVMKETLIRVFMTTTTTTTAATTKNEDQTQTTSFKVSIVNAKFEADLVIAQMAQSKQFRIILSNDSDFFIFSLPPNVGYAPFGHLQLVQQQQSSERADEAPAHHIYVLSIEKKHVMRMLDIKNPKYLPLIPCLAGCDYIDPSSLAPVIRHMISKCDIKKRNVNPLEVITQFLKKHSNEDPEQLILQLYKHVAKEHRTKMEPLAKELIQYYRVNPIDKVLVMNNESEESSTLSLFHQAFMVEENIPRITLEHTSVGSETSSMLLAPIRQRILEHAAFKTGGIIHDTRDTVTITEFVFQGNKVTKVPLELKRSNYLQNCTGKDPLQLFCYVWSLDHQSVSTTLLAMEDDNQCYRNLYLIAIFSMLNHLREKHRYTYTEDECRTLLQCLLCTDVHSAPLKPNNQLFEFREHYRLIALFSSMLQMLSLCITELDLPFQPFFDIVYSYSGLRLYAMLQDKNSHHSFDDETFQCVCQSSGL